MEIKENEILANHSTFKIGGPARYFILAKSKDEIQKAIDFAKEKGLDFFVFGGGSNILFSDEGYDGVVIKFISDSKLKIENSLVKASAGIPLGRVILESSKNGLTGLEWGIGIPGTLGGCVADNCGAYGHSISEFIENVEVIDREGKIKKYSGKECCFDYRQSRFKGVQTKEIILEITLKLKEGLQEEIQNKISEILKKRSVKKISYPSAGSVFKNIIIDELENKDEFLKLVPGDKIKDGKFPTGWLIEDCGLKGFQIGGAKISEEHCNFIVNTGSASAKDVLGVIKVCKEKVREKFNIELEEEIVIL